MNRLIEGTLPYRHDPSHRGIFVQKTTGSSFCVTFPRMANLGHDDEVLFPSKDFKTFSQAYDFAHHVREIDSRIKSCKIYLCSQKWIGSVGHRVTQEVG